LASAGIAISMALDATAAAQAPMRVVVVQAAFYAGSAFALLLLAYSTLYFLLRNKG
jgi:NADH:ubiquinone oxidoreductase subunit 6 (subunit J)